MVIKFNAKTENQRLWVKKLIILELQYLTGREPMDTHRPAFTHQPDKVEFTDMHGGGKTTLTPRSIQTKQSTFNHVIPLPRQQ